MKIYYPENLFRTLKDKHLLLDTNVFIDSFNFAQPQDYVLFFNKLKDNNTTLTTIDGVVMEFLKGSKSEEVYSKKNEHIENIIDVKLPFFQEESATIHELIKLYKAGGGSVELVDYHLGANLMKYKHNLFLMTRNSKDFPQDIFSLESTISFASSKTIFTYGIYTYGKKEIQKGVILKGALF